MERKPFEQRFNAMKQEAQSWTAAWKDLASYIRPTRGFFDELPNQGKTVDHKTIIDGSPARSSRILAAGMTSGLTSPSRPWFKLGFGDSAANEFTPGKLWLDMCQQRMMTIFSKSNIYGVLHALYEEIGPFGTGAAIILEDYNDVIRGRNFTIGEYYLGAGANGRVNSFARLYYMTVAQMVTEFGLDNCPDVVKSYYKDNKVDQWCKIYHLIEPNDDRIDGKKDFMNMPYRSVYWAEQSENDSFLKYSGFEDFPILAPRWDLTTTADIYGKSPGWEAIGDVKMLQKMQRDKLIALDKMVDPPLQADSSVEGEVNSLPGGVTRTSSMTPNGGVRPAYQVQPDLQSLEISIEKTQNAIGKTFYTDLFLMLAQSDRRQMTAREVVEKHEEKLLMLGPVLERLESELLDPLIDRTFNIMLRAGLVPPAPKELQGMDIKIDYISMLAQAQKMVGTTAIEQAVGFVGNLAGVFPSVLDNIDSDEVVNEYADMLGVPAKIIRSKEDVAAIREAKQKAQEEAAQAQNMGATVQGAKVLSDAKLGTNSALDAVLTGLGGVNNSLK